MLDTAYMPSGFKPIRHLGQYCGRVAYREASPELPAAWVAVLLGWGPTCYREGKTRGAAIAGIRQLLPRDAKILWEE